MAAYSQQVQANDELKADNTVFSYFPKVREVENNIAIAGINSRLLR